MPEHLSCFWLYLAEPVIRPGMNYFVCLLFSFASLLTVQSGAGRQGPEVQEGHPHGLEPYAAMEALDADSLLRLSRSHAESGNYRKAIYAKQEYLGRETGLTAPQEQEQAGNDTQIITKSHTRGEVLHELAFLYHQLGEFDRSLTHLMEALELYKALNDRHGKARTYNNIANIYSRFGDFDLALEYYLRSLGCFGDKITDREASITYANIGYAKGQFEMYDEAMYYLNKSIDLAREVEEDDIAGQLLNIGYIHSSNERFEEAITYYHQAIDNSRKMGNQWNLARSLNNQASVYLELGNHTQAQARMHEAQSIIDDHDFRELKQHNVLLLSMLHESQGRHAEALAYYKQYEQLNEELYSIEKQKLVSELKTLHELERKEQQIQLLEVEREIISREIEARRTRSRMILLGSGVFMLLAGMLYFQSRLKMKAYHQLVEKNLEIIDKEDSFFFSEKELKDMPVESFADEYTSANYPSPAQKPVPSGEKTNSSARISDIQAKDLTNKVKHAFENEKVFTDPELSLYKLADLIRTNNRYLSQAINESFKKSFIHLVNEYRIREARKLLADPQHDHYTIESVANMVGFKSKTTFNRSFKKITGLTPSFFQKSTRDSRLSTG